MKTCAIKAVLICVVVCIASVAYSIEMPEIGYKLKGDWHSITWRMGRPGPLVSNMPFGGAAVLSNTVILWVNGDTGAVYKISAITNYPPPLVLIIEDNPPRKVKVDGGGTGELPYMYIEGPVKNIKLKGYQSVGKIAVSNSGAEAGVKIINASKAPKGTILSSMWSVIVTGPLKKFMAKKCGLGGTGAENPGFLVTGEGSKKAKVKVSGEGLHYILMCGSVTSNLFNEAYNACWAAQDIVPAYVQEGEIKKIKSPSYGPGICGITVDKKIPAKKLEKIPVIDFVGMENIFDME